MKKILIKEISKGQLKLHIEGKPNVDEIMNMLFTAALHTMNNAAMNAPESKRQEVKQYLYDSLNESASLTLQTFMPDNELRPDMTFDAIKEIENREMQKHINKAKAIGALDA